MTNPVGPFNYSFCTTCACNESQLTRGVRLNIVNDDLARAGVSVTTYAGAPSVNKNELIAAIMREKGGKATNASASVTFDIKTREVKVVGPITDYTHECNFVPDAFAQLDALRKNARR